MVTKKLLYSKSYREERRLYVPLRIRSEIYGEKYLFSNMVATLVTLDDKAYSNDTKRYCGDLDRVEGGIIFKDSAVVIHSDHVGLKDSEIPYRKQNPIYPVITARVINELCQLFDNTKGNSVKDRLITAGLKLLDMKIPKEVFLNECRKFTVGYWRYFFGENIDTLYSVKYWDIIPKRVIIEKNNCMYVLKEYRHSDPSCTTPMYDIDISDAASRKMIMQEIGKKYNNLHAYIYFHKQKGCSNPCHYYYEVMQGLYREHDRGLLYNPLPWYDCKGEISILNPSTYMHGY